MSVQLHFEDVEVGGSVRSLTKCPSTRDLVKWAAGSGDYYEVHYDREFAQDQGLTDVIVHGRLKTAYLTQMITDWIGKRGAVRKFSVRYRETDSPRKQLTCRGTVTAKYEQGADYWVECEVWIENERGEKTTTGKFAVTLPTNKQD